jgi:hypothetical protein
MILTDAHTHIYPCFDPDILVDSAFANFARAIAEHGADRSGVLVVNDTSGTESFARLKEKAQPNSDNVCRYQVFTTGELTSVGLEHQHYPNIRLFCIAGCQAVTRERLEVLGLGVNQRPADAATLEETVATILDSGGLVILPWGVGKWLGQRYDRLCQFLESQTGERIFVGDNGNRPSFWPTPGIFSQSDSNNLRILSGSDPLPMPGEEKRIGTFGSIIHTELERNCPAESLIRSLSVEQTRITPFGSLQAPFSFLRQQVSLRLR